MHRAQQSGSDAAASSGDLNLLNLLKWKDGMPPKVRKSLKFVRLPRRITI